MSGREDNHMVYRQGSGRALVLLAAFIIISFSLCDVCVAQKPICYKTVPKSWVCLTVDDGSSNASIRSIHKMLKRYDVKCTFFVIGTYLLRKDNQPLWRQAVQDGHEICYHTMRHQYATCMSKKQILADVAAWERAARVVLGDAYVIPKFARLPGGSGSYDSRVLNAYAECGYTVIRWNVDTLTGPRSRNISTKQYIHRVTGPGAIILTHFNGADASALPGYIGWLKQKYRLGRLSDALTPVETPASMS